MPAATERGLGRRDEGAAVFGGVRAGGKESPHCTIWNIKKPAARGSTGRRAVVPGWQVSVRVILSEIPQRGSTARHPVVPGPLVCPQRFKRMSMY